MEIIGHRGAKGLAPENTIKSIKRGLLNHADVIEIDVRLQGKKLVLSHDPTTKTREYTTLDEALKTVNGKAPINLDVKEVAAVKHLKKAVEDYKGELIYSSFEFKILYELKQQMPNAQLAVIEKWSGVRAVTEASLLGTNRVHIKQQWLWSGFVRSMKHRGFNLYAYTVNSRDRAQELEEWGIDGIFTDYPSLFKGDWRES